MEKMKGRVEWKLLGFGTATSLSGYLLSLLLAAYLTVSGRIGEEMVDRAVWLCALLAAFAGALIASWGKRGTALLALFNAAAFWMAAVLVGFLSADGVELMEVAKLLTACAPGGLLALGVTQHGKGKRGKRHKTTRSRRVT